MRDKLCDVDFLVHRLALVIYRVLRAEYGARDYLSKLMGDETVTGSTAPMFAVLYITPGAEGAHAGQAPLEVYDVVLEPIFRCRGYIRHIAGYRRF